MFTTSWSVLYASSKQKLLITVIGSTKRSYSSPKSSLVFKIAFYFYFHLRKSWACWCFSVLLQTFVLQSWKVRPILSNIEELRLLALVLCPLSSVISLFEWCIKQQEKHLGNGGVFLSKLKKCMYFYLYFIWMRLLLCSVAVSICTGLQLDRIQC